MRRVWVWLLLLTLCGGGCRREGVPKAVEVREDGALELKLATFNVRYEGTQDRDWKAWPRRIGRVVAALREMDPDVFGVQEALHGQAADLRASMVDYDFVGVGRDDGERAGEYAPIFWRKDRFELDAEDHGTFWLSERPEEAGSRSWGNDHVRVVSWVRLTDRASGRGFYVFNTHWDHRSQDSREYSALLMASRIDGRRHSGEPVVLLGDFNATEGNPAVDYFLGKPVDLAGRTGEFWNGGLEDPFQKLHAGVRNRRTLHFWRGHREGWAKIDHIFVSRGAEIEAAGIEYGGSVPELQPSDHYPVWVKVRWEWQKLSDRSGGE